MNVVSDTSPLVNLSRVGQLVLLPQLYGKRNRLTRGKACPARSLSIRRMVGTGSF